MMSRTAHCRREPAVQGFEEIAAGRTAAAKGGLVRQLNGRYDDDHGAVSHAFGGTRMSRPLQPRRTER